MLASKDKVRCVGLYHNYSLIKVEDWRNRRESFGHRMGGREGDKRAAN